ncbi:ribonuclease H2 subunit B [Punica granatum]|uniref:Ribonuclease H2 subunit B n=2 Tax=Punica granatum TaxID=22663 RepID=A0A218XPF0_PUNGR|nr:ribonuclease H2 subunit B [Punica granatum]OWM87105.1 hypothetical protein CDL15_Pgr027040 [Punica granatum]PKI60816.1 hypothetical protein CRG98_018805 [Punica granatum]
MEMGWWGGTEEETRILISPAETRAGHFLSLRHPKTGKGACYLLANEKLHELHWFKLPYGSWFLGDYVCRDGSLYYATPVDLVFILLPIFDEARMKKGEDSGKFRQLDEILFVNGYPEYRRLLPIAEKYMQVVCEVREIGSSKFFRLDDSKLLAWLLYKAHQLKNTIPTLGDNYAARTENETLTDAVSIIGDYLKDEPWLKCLCDNLKVNLPEGPKQTADNRILLAAIDNGLCSPIVSQDKNGTEKRAAKPGKQAKKAKVETESKNIRDMFTRASRRRG